MLILICTVCTAPMFIGPEAERYLAISSHIICKSCNQASKITPEIKEFVKNRKGIKND